MKNSSINGAASSSEPDQGQTSSSQGQTSSSRGQISEPHDAENGMIRDTELEIKELAVDTEDGHDNESTLLDRPSTTYTKSKHNLALFSEMPFCSMRDLNPQFLSDLPQAHYFQDRDETTLHKSGPRKALCLHYLLLFCASAGFSPLRVMQTSLNAHHQVGNLANSLTYLCSAIGVFVCPTLIVRLGLKQTIYIGMTSYLLYVTSNIYPSYYTLVPCSLMMGFGFVFLHMAAVVSHTNMALKYAAVSQSGSAKILSYTSALYFISIQAGSAFGNVLASSVLLSLGPSTAESHGYNRSDLVMCHVHDDVNNATICQCGHRFLDVSLSHHSSPKVTMISYYSLLGILWLIVCVALIAYICAMDRGIVCLDTVNNQQQHSKRSVWEYIVQMYKRHKTWKTWLLLPMITYSSFSTALVYSELTKAYVTCPLSIRVLGYVVSCYIVSGAVAAYVIARIVVVTGAKVLQHIGSVSALVLYIIMLLWEPRPDQLYLVVLLFCCLGLTFSIYQTTSLNLVDILYRVDNSTTQALFLVYQLLTASLAYGLLPLLSIQTILYVAIVYTGLCAATYTLLTRNWSKPYSAQYWD